MTYNLKIKYKGESGFWNTSVFAENDDEAVEKARFMIGLKPQKIIEKAVLEKCITKFKKVKDILEE